jgi:Tol biopolymer transport system component
MAKLSIRILMVVTVVHVAVIALAVVIGAGVPSKQLAIATRLGKVLVLRDFNRSHVVEQNFGQSIIKLDWMPDGEILLITALKNYRETLYQWREGKFYEQRELSNQHNVEWSPDRTKIAYSSYNQFAITPNYDLYISNPDGQNVIVAANSLRSESPDTWSPDGTKLIYWSKHHEYWGWAGGGVWVFNLLSGQSEYLTEGADYSTVSPDGKYMFIQQEAHEPLYTIPFISIYDLVEQDSLRDFTVDAVHLNMHHPRWSPDGSEVVFVHDHRIFISTLDGTNSRLIAESQSQYSLKYPIWSLDGRSIIYFIDSGVSSLYYIPDVDNPQSQLLYEGVGGLPVWRPTEQ